MGNELQPVEDRIIAEWNWVRGLIATNQTVSLGIVCGVAWMLGHWHFPI